MTKSDLERRLESAEKQMTGLQDEIKNLKAKLDEIEPEKEIPDIPNFCDDDRFWFVNLNSFDVEADTTYGVSAVDFNMFHTREMAREFADKCKLIAMMLHCKWYLCPDYTPDFTDSGERKWYVLYNPSKAYYDFNCHINLCRNEVYFDSAENAKKCADWLNEHWRDE